jgi:hypothetical protein
VESLRNINFFIIKTLIFRESQVKIITTSNNKSNVERYFSNTLIAPFLSVSYDPQGEFLV